MQVTKPTQDQINKAILEVEYDKGLKNKEWVFRVCSKAIEIALAEQATEQYITAEEVEAFEKAGGKVVKCVDRFAIGRPIVYRIIKQPELLDLSNLKGVGRNFEIKQPEPVEPTCQVRNEDTDELKTMTREDAIKLYKALGDTVYWAAHDTPDCYCECITAFDPEYLYTYKLKQPKLIPLDWKDVPVGVAVVYQSNTYMYLGIRHECALLIANGVSTTVYQQLSDLALAPASERPWIARQDGIEYPLTGFTYVRKKDVFRITGLADGYGYPEQKGGC